jgi:hypothetical protein
LSRECLAVEHNYLAFILDGQMAERYLDSPAKRKMILLQSLEEPTTR